LELEFDPGCVPGCVMVVVEFVVLVVFHGCQ